MPDAPDEPTLELGHGQRPERPEDGTETAMMGWYDGDHMTGWGWAGMTLSSLLFIALLVLGGALLIRLARRPERADAPRSPREILAQRYARGELTDEQYRQQLATLRDTDALSR